MSTRANGDHCYGNQLLAGPGVEFVSSHATSDEISEVPAGRLTGLVQASTGNVGEFLRAAFGAFDFSGIDVPPMTTTFSGRTSVTVGGRTVELIEVGPAHTAGDLLAWLPDERVLFTGDILFIGGTPIMWAGPIGNWIRACDLIAELQPAVIVPGHGPLTDVAGATEVGDYLRLIRDGVTSRHAAGMTPREASLDLDTELNGTRFGIWSDRERLVATVHTMWKEVEPGYSPPDVMAVFEMMAADWKRGQAASEGTAP
ncbi:MAG: MBL fold metallo-hydrolase [Acidimicrobiales bacterium]